MSFLRLLICFFLTRSIWIAYYENPWLTGSYPPNCVGIAFSLRRIAFLVCREPAGSLGSPFDLDPAIALQLTEQGLHLVAAEAGKHLLKFLKPGPGCSRIFDVPEQERLVRLPIQAPFSGIRAAPAHKPIEPPREQIPCAAPSAHALDDALLQETLDTRGQIRRDRLLTVDEVDNEKILCGKGSRPLAADFLKKSEKFRVLDFAMERDPD